MPFRDFLQSGSRVPRFFVVALALLQLVAASWHVCELGGHGTSTASHHRAAPIAETAPNSPLICFCPAPQKPLDPKTPRLDGTSPPHHATCLALLLQSMPEQIAAPLAIFESRVLAALDFQLQRHQTPLLAAPRRFRGRAPPVKC